VFLVFKWRRITEQATIISVLISLAMIVVVPLLVPAIPTLSQIPALHALTKEQREVAPSTKKITVIPPTPLYFERIVKVRPDDPLSPKQGEGRFQFEVFLASWLGFDFSNFEPAQLLAYQYLFDSLLPFLLLFPLSFLTRENDPGRAERFYVKMRTRAEADPEKDAANLNYAYAHPLETEKRKLFHGSHWEFQRWRKEDYIAFPLSCLVALAILGIFSFVLTIGRK
jgi:SSS family solute:Na+ symporter